MGARLPNMEESVHDTFLEQIKRDAACLPSSGDIFGQKPKASSFASQTMQNTWPSQGRPNTIEADAVFMSAMTRSAAAAESKPSAALRKPSSEIFGGDAPVAALRKPSSESQPSTRPASSPRQVWGSDLPPSPRQGVRAESPRQVWSSDLPPSPRSKYSNMNDTV